MTPTELPIAHKVLLVDDDDGVRDMMTVTLEHKGFEVVAAASVTEALRHISTENFDVLITDLHMPNPGDGFTVVTAMRHSQPNALTLLISGYPDVQSAMAAILLEADEILRRVVETVPGIQMAVSLRPGQLARKISPDRRTIRKTRRSAPWTNSLLRTGEKRAAPLWDYSFLPPPSSSRQSRIHTRIWRSVPVLQVHARKQGVGAAIDKFHRDVSRCMAKRAIVTHSESIFGVVTARVPSIDSRHGAGVGCDESGQRTSAPKGIEDVAMKLCFGCRTAVSQVWLHGVCDCSRTGSVSRIDQCLRLC